MKTFFVEVNDVGVDFVIVCEGENIKFSVFFNELRSLIPLIRSVRGVEHKWTKIKEDLTLEFLDWFISYIDSLDEQPIDDAALREAVVSIVEKRLGRK